MTINRNVFDELFVLEMANNHWGSLERGLQIVQDFSKVVRYNNVRAAIKLQFRDIDSFIHPDYRDREDVRYIKKTLDTRMSVDDFEDAVFKTEYEPPAKKSNRKNDENVEENAEENAEGNEKTQGEQEVS